MHSIKILLVIQKEFFMITVLGFGLVSLVLTAVLTNQIKWGHKVRWTIKLPLLNLSGLLLTQVIILICALFTSGGFSAVLLGILLGAIIGSYYKA